MVSRRTLLAASAGGAVGAVLPAVTSTVAAARPTVTPTVAAARPWTVPQVLASTRGVRDGRLRVMSTGFRLTHLSMRWRGPAAQVRFLGDTGAWSRWQLVGGGCPGGRDDRDDEGCGALLPAAGALGYEVRVAGGGAAQVTELNTVDGPASTLTVAPAVGMPLPDGGVCDVTYLSRAAWGADESWRDDDIFPSDYYPAQTVTVHHTGPVSGSDPGAIVRAIYYNQAVTKGWGDIGYHFLIDSAGRVYEGRWSDADGVPGFSGEPGADGRPLMVTGAHVGGFNSGNIGICLIGDFTDELPTDAAQESLIRLLTALTRVCRLDPLATIEYVNPISSVRRTIRTVPGHREWADTDCPGDLFYPELSAIRTEVAERLLD